mgnify:CR=1 FL=1
MGTAGSSNGRPVANPFLHAIAVVAFDTDAGQKVETVCPPGAVRGVVERSVLAPRGASCPCVSMLACTASRQANQRCSTCTAVQGSVRPTAGPRTAAEHLGRQLRHAVFVPGAVVRASHRTLSNASRSFVALTRRLGVCLPPLLLLCWGRVRSDGLPLYACSPHDHVFLFATAYFRQVRDATVHRGYTQVRRHFAR